MTDMEEKITVPCRLCGCVSGTEEAVDKFLSGHGEGAGSVDISVKIEGNVQSGDYAGQMFSVPSPHPFPVGKVWEVLYSVYDFTEGGYVETKIFGTRESAKKEFDSFVRSEMRDGACASVFGYEYGCDEEKFLKSPYVKVCNDVDFVYDDLNRSLIIRMREKEVKFETWG